MVTHNGLNIGEWFTSIIFNGFSNLFIIRLERDPTFFCSAKVPGTTPSSQLVLITGWTRLMSTIHSQRSGSTISTTFELSLSPYPAGQDGRTDNIHHAHMLTNWIPGMKRLGWSVIFTTYADSSNCSSYFHSH